MFYTYVHICNLFVYTYVFYIYICLLLIHMYNYVYNHIILRVSIFVYISIHTEEHIHVHVYVSHWQPVSHRTPHYTVGIFDDIRQRYCESKSTCMFIHIRKKIIRTASRNIQPHLFTFV